MSVEAEQRQELPDKEAALEWLHAMTLIRRFEERAGEMYAKAKVGGFLHLAIGEEATIVGAVRAMRDEDYLISTYRSHGHALSRGADRNKVMAELFGRESGVSHGRGGSMHMFDLENRFMGGYGIVGGNLPLAAVKTPGSARKLRTEILALDASVTRAVETAGRGGQPSQADIAAIRAARQRAAKRYAQLGMRACAGL